MPLRRDRDLDHAVTLTGEQLVRFLDLVERKAMRDEWPQVERTRAHDVDQAAHSLLPARAERRHDLVIADPRGERVERDQQLARVDAEARQGAARAQDAQAALERLLRPERLDRDVD